MMPIRISNKIALILYLSMSSYGWCIKEGNIIRTLSNLILTKEVQFIGMKCI